MTQTPSVRPTGHLALSVVLSGGLSLAWRRLRAVKRASHPHKSCPSSPTPRAPPPAPRSPPTVFRESSALASKPKNRAKRAGIRLEVCSCPKRRALESSSLRSRSLAAQTCQRWSTRLAQSEGGGRGWTLSPSILFYPILAFPFLPEIGSRTPGSRGL